VGIADQQKAEKQGRDDSIRAKGTIVVQPVHF